jgi:hypothetical protein
MSRSPWVCMTCYQGRKWCGKYHPHIEYSINYGKKVSENR